MNADILLPVVYRLDASDCFTFVNDAWDKFAIENGGEHLVSGSVVGRSIWEFIDDVETKHLYRLLFDQIRVKRKSTTVSFRCDAPHLRRHMEMTISCNTASILEFSSRIVRMEHRTPVYMQPGDTSARAWITLCSWCKQARTPSGWMEIELALPLLDPFSEHAFPAVTHGICPECQKKLEMEVFGTPG